MADARITSGDGDGAVKTYTRGPDGKITVRGKKLAGVSITARLEAEGVITDVGETRGRMDFEHSLVAPVGRYTLVVETGRTSGKVMRQQIQVVDG
jgi:hypothetical protein